MGGGHGHGPAAEHVGGRYRGRLTAAFALTAAFLTVEVVAGLAAGSLALLSDAGHMASDVVGLGAALLATRIATRPDRSHRRTYGSYRAEVFASGLSVLLMLGVGAYVVVEAVRRVGAEVAVGSTTMLVVGAVGLLVNLAALALLRGGSRESLNVRGAYLEVVADAAGSAGVMVAGALVLWTGQVWWDTAVALAIGIFVMVRALVLGRQVLAVLGQHVPEGMSAARVDADLAALPGVREVHDLHLWTLTSGMHVATAHLVATEDADHPTVLEEARRLLAERYGIAHATLQIETATTAGCREITW